MRLGVDVGGTFTDVISWDGKRVRLTKTMTTPDQSDGVESGARRLLGGAGAEVLLHGTTVATNAVLEHTGARVALVTNAGFEDVIEIGRQDRPSLYDPMVDRPTPLVPRHLRFGLVESSGGSGADVPLELVAAAPEAVAVAFLYGFARPAFEEAVRDRLAETMPGVPCSVSSRVSPEFREFERVSTTVLNAYLMPLVGRYLRSLERRLQDATAAVLVMRSSGGLMGIEAARDLPVAVLLSGPAGGAMAAAALCRAHRLERAVAFDMGGTSTDVCRIEGGEPVLTYQRPVGGYPCQMPAVAIHTVGAGGGSISWVDPGGALRVGPRSAGSFPGPACYGRGGREVTVTDAHVVLGRIGTSTLLGRTVRVRSDLARGVMARLPGTLPGAAAGVVEVADSHMEQAIRAASLGEGADPRGATLVAFGGAGPLHATALAKRLEMAQVVVPSHAGVFSALGLLLSPMRADASLSLGSSDDLEGPVRDAVREVGRKAEERLRSMGSEPDRVDLILDVRYRGQSHETHISFDPGEPWADLEAKFHGAHERANGFARRGDPIEVVTVRAQATTTPPLDWRDLGWRPQRGYPSRGTRTLVGPHGEAEATVWWRPCLQPGHRVNGPAVIESADATVYLDAGDVGTVTEDGCLVVRW